MVGMLLDWRLYTKLKSTYIDALPVLLSPETGRLHTTFQQAVAATGRLSSIDPNLQNIPIRTELGRMIRHAFVSGDPDCVLMAADYSQIELRILAHVSGDVHLREAFERRADIHRETAARVLKKDPAEVTADERSMAKMVNFGLAYGMSDFGLASAGRASRGPRRRTSSPATSRPTAASATTCSTSARRRARRATSRRSSGRRRWIPELEARNASLRGVGGADGHQHAHPGHRRGHHEDRHDPAPRAAAPRGLAGADAAVGARRGGPRGAARAGRRSSRRWCARPWRSALALDVPLDVDVKVGDDWESMTVLPRGRVDPALGRLAALAHRWPEAASRPAHAPGQTHGGAVEWPSRLATADTARRPSGAHASGSVHVATAGDPTSAHRGPAVGAVMGRTAEGRSVRCMRSARACGGRTWHSGQPWPGHVAGCGINRRRAAPGGRGVRTVRRASRETRRKLETWWTGRMWLDSPA